MEKTWIARNGFLEDTRKKKQKRKRSKRRLLQIFWGPKEAGKSRGKPCCQDKKVGFVLLLGWGRWEGGSRGSLFQSKQCKWGWAKGNKIFGGGEKAEEKVLSRVTGGQKLLRLGKRSAGVCKGAGEGGGGTPRLHQRTGPKKGKKKPTSKKRVTFTKQSPGAKKKRDRGRCHCGGTNAGGG